MVGTDPTKKKKKNKPPKGFAQLPEWWMEVTPHNTLDVEEDEARRLSDSKRVLMYKDLAAKSDWEQVNGESKFTVGENGELIDKETGEPIETGGDSGYTRDEKTGEWLKDGRPIFGRQFHEGSSSSAGYGHKDVNWKKPDWMKVQLKKTSTGAIMKKGDYIEKKYQQG
mmetsp:Transcript_5288/g.15384  ORF Transcript_5288/g.15384 Transcript_5288/m.15384 type:complete len:168 (-) Transcript_5288:2533-3036(-)